MTFIFFRFFYGVKKIVLGNSFYAQDNYVLGNIFFKIFYSNNFKYIFMIINAATLKEFLDHVPGDYEIIFYDTNSNISHPIQDKVELAISDKQVVLKS